MTDQDLENSAPSQASSGGRAKFIVGGLLIVAAIVYLIVTSTQASAQYFLTVDELTERIKAPRLAAMCAFLELYLETRSSMIRNH